MTISLTPTHCLQSSLSLFLTLCSCQKKKIYNTNVPWTIFVAFLLSALNNKSTLSAQSYWRRATPSALALTVALSPSCAPVWSVFIVYLRQPAKKNPKKAANMGLCSGKLRKCTKKRHMEHVRARLGYVDAMLVSLLCLGYSRLEVWLVTVTKKTCNVNENIEVYFDLVREQKRGKS